MAEAAREPDSHMYRDWEIVRWDTPVVDINRLLMVSLVDANQELTILLEAQREGRPRWRVRFKDYQAYRNIDEMYRTDLWRWLDESEQRCGHTFTVREPSPLGSWGTVYLHQMLPQVRHYVITTGDDVVEVLAAEEPVWEQAEPALPGDTRAGKAIHLHFGQDDDEIARLSAERERRSGNKNKGSG